MDASSPRAGLGRAWAYSWQGWRGLSHPFHEEGQRVAIGVGGAATEASSCLSHGSCLWLCSLSALTAQRGLGRTKFHPLQSYSSQECRHYSQHQPLSPAHFL